MSSFTTELTNELNLLMQFNLKNEQDGIKIHHQATTETIAAAGRLYNKGLITQNDGGYLTDLGRKAAEHTQDLSTILR
ncbi:MAG TPA: TIGR02647 family protein [Gammaproteobacteria bacterium]|nr:TIGR02647 family protein [Gammaproteobacteria bacterium]